MNFNFILRSAAGTILVILVLLILPSVEKALIYLPLLFALSVSLFHFSHFKIHPLLGGLAFIAQSYAVFLGLAIALYFSEDLVQDLVLADDDHNASLKGIILVTAGGYLAALLLYYFSTFLFKISRKKRGYLLISLGYILIITVMQVFSSHEYLQFGVEKFTSFLISWVIFMTLSFSVNLSLSHSKPSSSSIRKP